MRYAIRSVIGKLPRHREPQIRALKCLGRKWKEVLVERMKAVRAVGRGEAHSPHGAKTKKDT